MSDFDFLPALHEPSEDKLEAHVWALLDGPRGQDIAVPENVLRAGIECWRLLAAGDASCSEAALQVANTVNRLLPEDPNRPRMSWDHFADSPPEAPHP